MSPLQVGALVAVLVGGALWCVAIATRRVPRSVAAARERMFGDSGAHSAGTSGRASWTDDLADGVPGRWVRRHFGVGLDIIDLSTADVISRALMSAAVMLFAVSAAVAALMSMGLLPLSPVWLLLSLALGAMAGWVALRDIAAKIERRRRELRQAANDFVQLVAVGLTTDQSVEEAIGFALGVGTSDAFDRLRAQVSTAPQRGVPVWEAIDEFGRRCDVRELCEFATSIERQGLQGVSIGETVASLAAAMRAKGLDELEREADQANANLSGPTIGFVVTTIVFLAYPLAQRISDAFGG